MKGSPEPLEQAVRAEVVAAAVEHAWGQLRAAQESWHGASLAPIWPGALDLPRARQARQDLHEAFDAVLAVLGRPGDPATADGWALGHLMGLVGQLWDETIRSADIERLAARLHSEGPEAREPIELGPGSQDD